MGKLFLCADIRQIFNVITLDFQFVTFAFSLNTKINYAILNKVVYYATLDNQSIYIYN